MKDETLGRLELLLDLGVLDGATELDDLLELIRLELIRLELITLELVGVELLTLDLAMLLGADDAAAPHKAPVTLGAPAVPLAWKPKLAEALGASVPFQPTEVAV